MTLGPVLALGFFLGMRHATDADHVVAVSTIVSRTRTLRAAAPIGILWGIGHTLTILLVGAAIILFGVVIPARLGLGMEFCVALMLILLGGLNLRNAVRPAAAQHEHHEHHEHHGHSHAHAAGHLSVRPLFVGIVHGLAGSAAVALLVLGTIHEPFWALGYLAVFGVGTIAGMLLITLAMAMPIAASTRRFERAQLVLAIATGLASVGFGTFLVYDLGFVHGLFSTHPQWTPE
ncbi:MAG: sulfite exporter TauE/SafE family protein [Polyangiaceae bacterium]